MSPIKPIQPIQIDKDIRNYTVVYHPYDPQYPVVFEHLRALIQAEAGPLRIEHIGSSSIPGVGGRKVIDIAVVAPEADHAKIREAIARAGFTDPPFQHYRPVQVGSIEADGESYQILVYVIAPEDPMLANWLGYRDYLRAHPEDAEAYGRVKREVLAAGQSNGEAYQRAKTPFIVELNARIQAKK